MSPPVSYRCIVPSHVALDNGSTRICSRVLELSEVGAFVEETRALHEVQVGELAVLALGFFNQAPWACRVRISALCRARVEVLHHQTEHVSVLVRGFKVEFEWVEEIELQRLRDFLEQLETHSF